MGLSKKPYRGTRDLFPPEKREQNFIFKSMHETAVLFGYENYDGPLLEEVELYKAKSGEELINEQIYSFLDRGERHVAIRPEMTPTLARMVSQIIKEKPKPLRWFSIPNLLRYEKPQRGRLREHWQFNCDIFGQEGRYGEFEIIDMACSLLKKFGANQEHFEVRLNDRAVVDSFFLDVLGLNDQLSYKMYKLIDKSKKIGEEQFNKELCSILPNSKDQNKIKDYLKLSTFADLDNFLQSFKQKNSSLDEIRNLISMIKNSYLKDFVLYDPYIVRGLDYYTGVVFEIFDKHPDNKRAICGGGTYRDLLKIFGEESINATGFGLGDVTLTDFLKTHELMPDFSKNDVSLFLGTQLENESTLLSSLAASFRQEGISVLQNFTALKPKKIFQLAEKNGCHFTTLFGEKEKSENIIIIKNLDSREQLEFGLNDIKSMCNFLKGIN